MCIVTHVHDCHFTNLMNYLSVIAIIKDGGNRKDRIKHGNEHFLTSHQVNQALGIMEYRPRIVPAVSFRKVTSPFQRREFRSELAVLLLATHQFTFRIKQVLIVHGTFGKKCDFLLRTFQFFRQLINTPVIVCIFQCTGCILMNLHITRHIAQLVIIFISQTSGRRNFRMYGFRSMNQSFV